MHNSIWVQSRPFSPIRSRLQVAYILTMYVNLRPWPNRQKILDFGLQSELSQRSQPVLRNSIWVQSCPFSPIRSRLQVAYILTMYVNLRPWPNRQKILDFGLQSELSQRSQPVLRNSIWVQSRPFSPIRSRLQVAYILTMYVNSNWITPPFIEGC